MESARSNRQTEHRVLAGPLGRSIAQASDADAARQSSFDGGLHQVGREERERDRHIDLSNAAFVTRSNLLDIGHGASNNLIKPTPAARDRCDECGAGLCANGSTVMMRHASRRDDISSPFHWRLLPWDAQNKSIMVLRVRRIAGCLLCLQLDRIKSTNRGSRIGGTTGREHRAGARRRCREAVVLRRQPSRAWARGTRARSSY
jgi:hypothetical protein